MFLFELENLKITNYNSFFTNFSAECAMFEESLSNFLLLFKENGKARKFDAHVGDCGCQYRASMFMTLWHHFKERKNVVDQFLQSIEKRLDHMKKVQDLYRKAQKEGFPKTGIDYFSFSQIHKLSLLHDEELISSSSSSDIIQIIYIYLSYYLNSLKEDSGLKMKNVSKSSKLMARGLQILISQMSVDHVCNVADFLGEDVRQLVNMRYRDDQNRVTIPVFLGFKVLLSFWKKSKFQLLFRIRKYVKIQNESKLLLSTHFIFVDYEDNSITTVQEEIIEKLNTYLIVIVIDCSSFDECFESLQRERQVFTSLEVDSNMHLYTPSENIPFQQSLTQLRLEQVEEILKAFFAIHPQLISTKLSSEKETDMIQRMGEGNVQEWRNFKNRSIDWKCNRQDLNLFLVEHIYCDSTSYFKNQVSL